VTTILIQKIFETWTKDELGYNFEQKRQKFREKSLYKDALLHPSHPAFEQGGRYTDWPIGSSI